MTALKISASDVRAALDARYADDAWKRNGIAPGDVLLHEVATPGGRRRIDSVLVRCWKSRGFEIHGFEIKVSRSDWLVELRQPEKAEPAIRRCNRWWIVAPAGVVKRDELPEGWGYMQLRADGKLVVSRAAPKLQPEPASPEWVAGLVRSAFTASRHEIADVRRWGAEEFQRGREAGRKDRPDYRELERMRERVAAFEGATGLQLEEFAPRWNSESPAAEALRLIQSAQGWRTIHERLSAVCSSLQGAESAARSERQRLAALVAELEAVGS